MIPRFPILAIKLTPPKISWFFFWWSMPLALLQNAFFSVFSLDLSWILYISLGNILLLGGGSVSRKQLLSSLHFHPVTLTIRHDIIIQQPSDIIGSFLPRRQKKERGRKEIRVARLDTEPTWKGTPKTYFFKKRESFFAALASFRLLWHKTIWQHWQEKEEGEIHVGSLRGEQGICGRME